MPCAKCGLNEAVTTAGLCKECMGKVSQSSYVYTPQVITPEGPYPMPPWSPMASDPLNQVHKGETDAI